jgi:hypothetical protein
MPWCVPVICRAFRSAAGTVAGGTGQARGVLISRVCRVRPTDRLGQAECGLKLSRVRSMQGDRFGQLTGRVADVDGLPGACHDTKSVEVQRNWAGIRRSDNLGRPNLPGQTVCNETSVVSLRILAGIGASMVAVLPRVVDQVAGVSTGASAAEGSGRSPFCPGLVSSGPIVAARRWVDTRMGAEAKECGHAVDPAGRC